jgi:hypothetical protein
MLFNATMFVVATKRQDASETRIPSKQAPSVEPIAFNDERVTREELHTSAYTEYLQG